MYRNSDYIQVSETKDLKDLTQSQHHMPNKYPPPTMHWLITFPPAPPSGQTLHFMTPQLPNNYPAFLKPFISRSVIAVVYIYS